MLDADILSSIEELVKETRKQNELFDKRSREQEELMREQTRILREIASSLRHLENRLQ